MQSSENIGGGGLAPNHNLRTHHHHHQQQQPHRKFSAQETIHIYTEWANHYLEKAKCKKQIIDLQVDVTDGVVLADVIEAVTSQRVPDIQRKPKSSQMQDNIQLCLVFLSQLGVALEDVSARDIRDGHLKSILSLFFQLSRFKQHQKQQDSDRHNNQRTSHQQSAHVAIHDNNSFGVMQHPHHQKPQHHLHSSSLGGADVGKGNNATTRHNPAESTKLPGVCKQHTNIPSPQQTGETVAGNIVSGSLDDNRAAAPLFSYSSTSGGREEPLDHHNFPQNRYLHHRHQVGGQLFTERAKKIGGTSSSSEAEKVKGVGCYTCVFSSVSLNGMKPTSRNSSRSTSPSAAAGNNEAGCSGDNTNSFFSQPRGTLLTPSAPSSARSSIHEKHYPSSGKIPYGPVSSTTVSSTSSTSSASVTRTQNNNVANIQQSSIQGQTQGKGGNSGSMLEKFKFFKDKDKKEKVKGNVASMGSYGGNKNRPSSSSDFSSARSERSDSSVSSDNKGVTNPSLSISTGVVLRHCAGDRVDALGKCGNTKMIVDSSYSSLTPRQANKGCRQKLGKATSTTAKQHPRDSSFSSPKSSRKNGNDVHSYQVPNDSSSKSSISSSKNKSREMTKQTNQELSGSSSDKNLAVVEIAGFDHSPVLSFIRQPKSQSGGVQRDNKYPVTGIPTRNSLISGGGSIREYPHKESDSNPGSANTNAVNINQGSGCNLNNNSVSTTSLNSTLSSNKPINTTYGLLQNLGNGTGIPKPTAAVKGTTKQPLALKQQPSFNESGAKEANKRNSGACVKENAGGVDVGNPSTPEVTFCSSSNSRPNASHNSFSSNTSSTDKRSTSIPSKSNDTNGGVTVALISPMPSLTSSMSNTALMSSVDSVAFICSQLSTTSVSHSNSNSNSSDLTVMLASQYQQQSSTNKSPHSMEECATKIIGGDSNSTTLNIGSNGSPPTSNKIQLVSDVGSSSNSGSSSMGSLNKVGVEIGSSSSGTSLMSPSGSEGDSNKKKDNKPGCGEKVKKEENNGNSVISECDEDDILLNVKPMEPLLRDSPYGCILSPPGSTTGSNNHPPGFFESLHKAGPNYIRMRRTGSCENALDQPTSYRVHVKSVGTQQGYSIATSNPYWGPSAFVTRRALPPSPDSLLTSGNAFSAAGEHDYVDIDNFDVNAEGYLSDGELLISGGGANGTDSSHQMNDGYVSESGVLIYGRRLSHPHNRLHSASGANNRVPNTNKIPGFQVENTPKHEMIIDDSFDDSSSISSEISDLNELPANLSSFYVNVPSPYDGFQRNHFVGETNSKVLHNLSDKTSAGATKKVEGAIQPSNIINRMVDSRSVGRRSTAADTSDLNTNNITSSNDINPGLAHKRCHAPHHRSATLPLGFLDLSRGVSYKHGHPVSNLSASESSSSLRGAGPAPIRSTTEQPLPTTRVLVLTGGGDYATRVVSRNKQPLPNEGSRNKECHGGGQQAGSHKQSMSNLDPRRGSSGGRKGMMGIKEDNCGGGGSTVTSSSSSGGVADNNVKPSSKRDVLGSPSPVGGAVGNGFGFMKKSCTGANKYAVPVTTAKVSGGKSFQSEVRDVQSMMTAEEFTQAHAALSVASAGASHISPYHVVTTIQQQHQNERAQSPKIRTKVKVSGGTQTTNDLHEMSGRGGGLSSLYSQQHPMIHHDHLNHSQTLPGNASSNHPQYRHHTSDHYASSTCSRNSGSFAQSSHGVGGFSSGYKSLSLTTPTAAQLSQSLKERLLGSQSLPKGATSSADYAAILAAIQQQHQSHHYHQIYGTPNASRERMSRYAAATALAGAGNGNAKNLDNLNGGHVAYNELYHSNGSEVGLGSTPYSWLRHSTGYASSITSAPTRLIGAGGRGSMTEAESIESLSSTSSMAVQLRDGRSNGLAQGRIHSAHKSRDREQGSPSRSPRLNRSNSIRSTKSEKLYPSMLQREEEGNPYYSSTMSASGVPNLPTSPIHGPTSRNCSGSGTSGLGGPYASAASTSSNHSVRLSMSPYSGFMSKLSAKDDDVNASSLSLVSTASSIYSSQEEKQAHEVRKLKRELSEAQEKVQTLTNQLTTNAHVVAAFEQSLSNMTQRLQTLTFTAEQKDSELTELRQTIDLLRKQSVEAGLTMAQMTETCEEGPMARQLSADSVSSINSISSTCSGASHSHTSSPSGQIQMTPSGTPTHSANLNMPESPGSKKKNPKGKGWLRSSFTKAFSRTKSKSRNDSSPEHDDRTIQEHENNTRQLLDGDQRGASFPPQYGTPPSSGQTSHGNYPHRHRIHRTIPNSHQQLQSPPHHFYHQVQSQTLGSSKMIGSSKATSPLLSPPLGDGRNKGCSMSTGSHSPRSNGGSSTIAHDGRSHQGSTSGLSEEPVEEPRSMDELRKQLREKEMVLTDIRLEALTSAHQLESLKETVTKMRNEMLSLRQDNERLQRMVTCKSLTSSQSSLQLAGGNDGVDRRLSASEVPPPSSSTLEMFLTGDATEKEGKRIVVSVYLGCHGSYERYISPVEGLPAQECVIGAISVSNRTKWDALDTLVKRAFKDYLMRIDPMSSLGLNVDSVLSYAVGDVLRTKEGSAPELLPCGYFVGDVTKIRVCLKGAVLCALDALAFETLVPRSALQRFMSLISDNGRIIICGPSGTGKSYMARKLGEYLVASSGKEPCPEAIASFSADHKNTKELRQYLANLAEQCDGTAGMDLPSVIILDNLHQIQNLGEVFNGVLLKQKEDSPTSEQSSKPIIIGTMTHSATAPPTAVHHNFRWAVFANHTEPVKGLLSRYLQRRLIEVDTQNGTKNLDLARIVDWIPKVWHHINKFLEAHNSGDVTIGPRLFLSCPMDVVNSQAWFADLWHYSVIPYLIEAVKEGLQQYGKRIAWEDPVEYLALTYPWSPNIPVQMGKPAFLQRIRPEDVGYDMKSSGPLGMGNGGSKTSSDRGTTADDADPLMNMLLRLQEAASYTGPPGNDADSRSLDSHIGSLDSKDFVATA